MGLSTNDGYWGGALMLTFTATKKIGRQIGQWLILSEHSALARRNMLTGWACVAALALVVSIWLPMSTLSLDRATWTALAKSLSEGAVAYMFCLAISDLLRKRDDRVAAFLRVALERFALVFRSGVLIAAIGSVGVIFSYLATSWALPLQDSFLARLDSYLGFDWLLFLGAVNDHPLWASLLQKSYGSTGLVAQGVVAWLSISGRADRLSEFLALLCLCSLGLAVGMLLVPAAGAFAYFEPARHSFDNFATGGEMWPFWSIFNGLRNGSLTTIDMSSVQGVVSFPSFHTMLGIITTYALRDTRALFIPAVMLNGTMIVATLPVGGHYLTDVLAGAAITGAAIYASQPGFARRTSSSRSITVVGGGFPSADGQQKSGASWGAYFLR
jgi:membrane-associated phospholipid phosphatase